MPDLLDSAGSSRGDRHLSAEPPAPAVQVEPSSFPQSETRNVPAARPGSSSAPVLLFERVSKWYGPVMGVNQVTLELRPGITGLVGSNGAGKSTLLRLASGQMRPDMGRVTVLGHDAWNIGARWLTGYCPESDAFYEEMSGRQFVQAMARLCGYSRREAAERTERVLRRVGMVDRSDRRLRGYSRGMRQRIKLAQALLHDPPLLILDEPLSGIDPVGRQEIVQLFLELAEQGKCLLVSSHELEELEKLTEHVAIMARGRIAAVGSIASIRDRLDDHPLAIRIEVSPAGSTPPARLFHVEPSAPSADSTPSTQRQLAARLLLLPQVVSVEILDPADEDALPALIVRAHHPRAFYRAFTRLVLEEWYDVRNLQPLDDSTAAVLGYLLGGHPGGARG